MKHKTAARFLTLLLVFVIPFEMFAQTQQDDAEAASSLISGWSVRLDAVAKKLEKPKIPDQALALRRDELEAIRAEARDWIVEKVPNLEVIQGELDALGPPPGEGDEPEAAGVAAQRKDLKVRLVAVTGPVKEAELIVGRTNRLISELSELRRKRFSDKILTRGPSPLSPSIWRLGRLEVGRITNSISRSMTRYTNSMTFRSRLSEAIVPLAIALIVAIILAWPVHKLVLRRYGRTETVTHPSFMDAVRATIVVGVARAFLPTAAAALIYLVMVSEELLVDAGKQIGQAILFGIVLFTWTIAFFRASLSPMYPDWRIVPVPTSIALGIRGIVLGLALAFAVDVVLSQIIVTYDARLAVRAIGDYTLTIVVVLLLLMLTLRQKMWIPEGEMRGRPRWRVLRLLIAAGLIVLLVLGAIGYVSLARFVVAQLVLTGALVLLWLFLHRMGREVIVHGVSPKTWAGEQLRATLRIDDEGANRFSFWLGLAYDCVLFLSGIIVGLFVWGADRKDVANWTYQALFGFKIGQLTISLVDIFVAILLFTGLVIATRFLQRVLAEQVLPQTQLDSGIRQSIRTSIGYIGIILAAVVGISALGLDMSNFAIVAGALSVGIGFGLQNVVNNFVSGLILLVERPVKVGDWVVVGDKQGYVKRIKVRATEIQTFDRASVFVPNSQLISESLTNWTYADKLGRVIIPIGVAYGSDTLLVRDTLLEIGNAHPEVLKDPAPSAVFRGFGDSALNFELRCYLHDVERTIGVTSDLCFQIDEAFRQKEIEIPFPQHDVYVKQMSPPVVESTSPLADSGEQKAS